MPISRSINTAMLGKELIFSASRSSGPGGQNVNKVNTKITLKFDVVHSEILNEEEKNNISDKLRSHLTKDGVLILSSQDKRSQLENKTAVILKLDALLKKAFQKRKVRKASKPSKTTLEKRIADKKFHAEKKKWRQKPE